LAPVIVRRAGRTIEYDDVLVLGLRS